MAKVIGIIGSRRRFHPDDYAATLAAFRDLYEPGDSIVSGGCPIGGDAFAERIAKTLQVPIKIYYAEWKRLGTSAGFVRNTDIAADADTLIACVAADRTGGAEDTITKFGTKGKVILI